MRDAFEFVATNYLTARTEPLKGHPVAQFLRHEAKQAVTSALGPISQNMIVKGSPGQGIWTFNPWVAAFDPVVTTSALRGHYVVYLFSADMRRLYLSLNQGTTAAHDEFKSHANAELERRAALLRDRVPEYKGKFSADRIELDATGFRPTGYEAGHAFGKTYRLDELPFDDILAEDLREIIERYFMATARGGTGHIGDPGASEVVREASRLLSADATGFIERSSAIQRPARRPRKSTAMFARHATLISKSNTAHLAADTSRPTT